jgi:hypothetical protein
VEPSLESDEYNVKSLIVNLYVRVKNLSLWFVAHGQAEDHVYTQDAHR